MTKVKSKMGIKIHKPIPLEKQIENETLAHQSERLKLSRTKANKMDDEFIGGKTSSKILEQSKSLNKELQLNDFDEFPMLGSRVTKQRPPMSNAMAVSFTKKGKNKEFVAKNKEENVSDIEEDDVDETENAVPMNVEQACAELTAFLDIDPLDKATLSHFDDVKPKQAKLVDSFRDKLTEIQTEIDDQSQAEFQPDLPEAVTNMCKELAKIMSRYRSGKLPKVLKMLHMFNCWEELLYLTNPDKWTAAAMYQGTRIFVSCLNSSMAQKFLNLVLLPRIRDDISFFKRLNYHLFQALKKSLFKPAAFFKGILFPLCEGGNCSLREAIIVGSVISDNSIPIAHSCAAIKVIAAMEYSGPNSIFLRILLEKKYALPYSVIDEVYSHFMRFENSKQTLPVLWHQALYTFMLRYKNDISSDQRSDILRLIRKQSHFKITPEIERELRDAANRTPVEEPMNVN